MVALGINGKVNNKARHQMDGGGQHAALKGLSI